MREDPQHPQHISRDIDSPPRHMKGRYQPKSQVEAAVKRHQANERSMDEGPKRRSAALLLSRQTLEQGPTSRVHHSPPCRGRVPHRNLARTPISVSGSSRRRCTVNPGFSSACLQNAQFNTHRQRVCSHCRTTKSTKSTYHCRHFTALPKVSPRTKASGDHFCRFRPPV